MQAAVLVAGAIFLPGKSPLLGRVGRLLMPGARLRTAFSGTAVRPPVSVRSLRSASENRMHEQHRCGQNGGQVFHHRFRVQFTQR